MKAGKDIGVNDFATALDQHCDQLDIRDPNLVIIDILKFLLGKFDCENIFWFRSGELERAIENSVQGEELGFYSLEDREEALCPMMVAKPFDPVAASSWLKSMAAETSLPQWLSDKGFYQPSAQSSLQWAGLSVVSRDVGEVLGQLIFIGDREVLERIGACWSLIESVTGRTLTYGLQMNVMRELSYMDHLTHLYNQRYLGVALDREIARVDRYGRHFSVLFMDIDCFKQVNDQYGHLVGSSIISEVGETIQGVIRECDYGFRFGGDEFVVILTETAGEEAQVVAERLRKTIESRTFFIDGEAYKITISVGVSVCPDHAKSREEILELADQAMYQGKNSTKNVVYIAS